MNQYDRPANLSYSTYFCFVVGLSYCGVVALELIGVPSAWLIGPMLVAVGCVVLEARKAWTPGALRIITYRFAVACSASFVVIWSLRGVLASRLASEWYSPFRYGAAALIFVLAFLYVRATRCCCHLEQDNLFLRRKLTKLAGGTSYAGRA